MGVGKLAEAVFIFAVCKSCVEDVYDVELGLEDMAPLRNKASLAAMYSL